MMERRKYQTLDEYFNGCGEAQNLFEIWQGIDPNRLPARDYESTWYCSDCGREGDVNRYFRSTLRTRARGHLNCRCIK